LLIINVLRSRTPLGHEYGLVVHPGKELT
jgi:hypothetical protein